MTHEEANDILNRFMGWETGARCPQCHERPTHRTPDDTWWDSYAHFWKIIPPFDYFADTPEARERVRLLKDEFVRQGLGNVLTARFRSEDGSVATDAFINAPLTPRRDHIESHAIAFAIAAALKENRE